MNNNNSNTGGSVGFAGLLTLLFIALKLMNVITWSWVWVLSPIWITLLLLIFVSAAIYFGTRQRWKQK